MTWLLPIAIVVVIAYVAVLALIHGATTLTGLDDDADQRDWNEYLAAKHARDAETRATLARLYAEQVRRRQTGRDGHGGDGEAA